MSSTRDNDHPEYLGLRPSGHYLMLLLRAAVADDGEGGPWLYVYRTNTPGGAPVYTHHIAATSAGLHSYSESRVLMLSGLEALAFAVEHEWASITHPTVPQLRALGTYAVEAGRIDQWASWRDAWLQTEGKRKQQRAERAKRAGGAVRSLRWALAEQWLRQPSE